MQNIETHNQFLLFLLAHSSTRNCDNYLCDNSFNVDSILCTSSPFLLSFLNTPLSSLTFSKWCISLCYIHIYLCNILWSSSQFKLLMRLFFLTKSDVCFISYLNTHFFFLVALGFELRNSPLLGRRSYHLATPAALGCTSLFLFSSRCFSAFCHVFSLICWLRNGFSFFQ